MIDDQKEQFTVVDKEDAILEYRSRYDCHHDRNLIHRVVYVVLCNNRGDVLMQKRSAVKDLSPGMYTTAASGHVSKGETYEQSAARELQEELGIQTPLTYVTKSVFSYDTQQEMSAIFKGEYNNDDFILDSSEVESANYFSQQELKNMKDNLTMGAIQCLAILGIL
jgi:isopentenyl-diphosphate Delta-isomerase